MNPSDRGRAGVALIEVAVGILILGLASVGVVSFVGTILWQQQELEMREAELRRAEQILGTLWVSDRTDLEGGLGTRSLGEFRTTVEQLSPGLFWLAVARSEQPGAALLTTVVFRPVEVVDPEEEP